MFQTEFEFILPKGYVDEKGELHKKGVMRLATAADEIRPQSDPRVKENPAYSTIIILSRVVTQIDGMHVDTNIIERLYSVDMAFLQDMFMRINQTDIPCYKSTCPECGARVEFPINFIQADG